MAPASTRTMPSYTPSAQAALLKSVCLFQTVPPAADRSAPPKADPLTVDASQTNRLFKLDRKADSLEEFSDGIILAEILHELDHEFDPSHLDTNPGTSKYLTNKRNIQAVYKGLFRFIRRQVPELSCQAKKFDYHAIAENPEPQGISQVRTPKSSLHAEGLHIRRALNSFILQLLAVMVSAAVMGPDNQRYVPRIQHSLDRDTQAEIMQIIQAMQQDISSARDDDDLDDAIDAVMEARDIDLLVEEQNASLRQQLDVTKKTLSDYITRLEYLQQSHEELKYDKERNDRELEVLRKATQDGANSAESIRILEAQVHEQMEIIARNEELIRNHDRTRAHLEGEVQRLTQRSMEVDELRDQVTEWKHKAEEFEKKANTAERYKQKLESQQHLVKEVHNLRYEKAELVEQLRSLSDDQEKNDRTRKAEDELTKMITQSEQHLWDERNQKTQLIRDVAALEEEMMRLKAQRTHDEQYIQDLQEQLQHGGGSTSQDDTPAATATVFSLEDELNSAANDDAQSATPSNVNLPLEFSRLKAENDLLRSTVGSTGDNAIIRRELEEEKRHRNRLQQNYNDMFEKHTIAQDQIEALMNHMTDEGLVRAIDAISKTWDKILTTSYCRSQAFVNLKTELLQANFELEQARKLERDQQTQIADKNRENLELRTQLSTMDKGSVEALNELKSTDNLISASIKAELDSLREEVKIMTSDMDAQKSQLIDALLAKEKFRKEVEEHKEAQEGLATNPTDPKGGELVTKLRDRLRERQQVSPLIQTLLYEEAEEEEEEKEGEEEDSQVASTRSSVDDDMSFSSVDQEPEVWPSHLYGRPECIDAVEAEMDLRDLPSLPPKVLFKPVKHEAKPFEPPEIPARPPGNGPQLERKLAALPRPWFSLVRDPRSSLLTNVQFSN